MQVLDNGGVEFTNEGRGARLRVFAALKHPFMKQAGHSRKPELFESDPIPTTSLHCRTRMPLLGFCEVSHVKGKRLDV